MLLRQQGIPITQLASLLPYNTFGGWLKAIREKYKLSQKQLAEVSAPYLQKAGVQTLGRRIVSALENDNRFPQFKELEPLYRCLVDKDGFRLTLSADERDLYIYFARKRIEERQKGESVSSEQWDDLTTRLILLSPNRKSGFHLVPKNDETEVSEQQIAQEEDPNSRRLQAIGDALRTDTRHLLEREEWVKNMCRFLEGTLLRKLIVVQGTVGIGKSYAEALLIQRLAGETNYYLIPYIFEVGEEKTPEDHLATFLATLLSDLSLTNASDKTKQAPLPARVTQVLSAIKSYQKKVVILLDNVQIIFPTAGSWSPDWAMFFEAFTKEPHNATLYLMTRTWSDWGDHPLTYVEEQSLPELSPEACISLWHRFGFTDVPEPILREISARCGYIPQNIELLVAQCQKRTFTTRWGSNNSPSSGSTSPNTARLEARLAQDTLFDLKTDKKCRALAQQVVTSGFSHQAMQMLTCLACSPLGLPFTLLAEEFVHAEEAFNDELVTASVIDLNLAASGRAALVPLVREVVLQTLADDGRRDAIESRVTDLYSYWLSEIQDFRDDHEKAGLVAEMIVRYIRSRRFLEADELLLSYWWLCSLFGQTGRIQRVFETCIKGNRGMIEEAKHEIGRLLLQHRVTIMKGQKVDRDERDQMYQEIYGRVVAGEIQLGPHAELEVLHNMLLLYNRRKRFGEAQAVFDQTLERLRHSRQMTPEVSARFLFDKALLMAQWWDAVENEGNQDEVHYLLRECVTILKESIAQWRLCLKNALPLQEHHTKFELARALNNYGYRLRLIGHLVEARKAIEESLRLKKESGELPHSRAISLSEYAQILVLQGEIRKALPFKEEAILMLERLSAENNTSHDSELGVFLFEHATILKQQNSLEEAKTELVRAIPLIGDKPSRQCFRLKAEKEMAEISFLLETGQRYQLDKRWFSRYLELASYDEVSWIAYAGPFSADEQTEWDRLCAQHRKEEVSDRLNALLVESRQREFAQSQQEHRTPRLWYPHIPLDEVQDRLKKFQQLQQEIESQEANALVRSLYREVIDEQINTMCQYKATVLGDQDTVWQCNLSLYGKVSTHEFYIALQSLCKMVIEAQRHGQASPVAQDIMHQLKTWGLALHEIAAMEFFSLKQEPVPSFKHKPVDDEREFSPVAIQRFFQDVLNSEYHTDEWNVEIDPTRTGACVNVNLKTLSLPPKPYSLDKIRELLAEEIGVHAYRSMSGQRSPLALLGSGLAQYSPTEEGLAKHAVQRVAFHTHGEERSKTWIGTLATGLASGVLTPALSFYELATFLEKRFLIEKLLSSKSIAWDKAVAFAKKRAWEYAARTFRAVPHLEETGCCSLKGANYLHGYLTVKQKLEQVEEQRLLVGKIGTEHLDAMSELNILEPFYPHSQLALAPDLFDRVVQHEK